MPSLAVSAFHVRLGTDDPAAVESQLRGVCRLARLCTVPLLCLPADAKIQQAQHQREGDDEQPCAHARNYIHAPPRITGSTVPLGRVRVPLRIRAKARACAPS